MLPAILQLLHAVGALPPRERRPRNLPAREGVLLHEIHRGVYDELEATETGSGATAARPPLWPAAVERRRLDAPSQATVVTNMGALFAFYEATGGANWQVWKLVSSLVQANRYGKCLWKGAYLPCNDGWPGSAAAASDPANDPCLGKSGATGFAAQGHWNGVLCAYGHVRGLSLWAKNLVGTIPPEFFDLVAPTGHAPHDDMCANSDRRPPPRN